jgi:hypothetical protein
MMLAGLAARIAAVRASLDESSDGSLPAAAVPFLPHPRPGVRAAAVRAVGRHGAADAIPGQLAPLLHDSSTKVVAAALRYLRGYALPPGVLVGLDAAGTRAPGGPRCRCDSILAPGSASRLTCSP